jgi:hypothetical protein
VGRGREIRLRMQQSCAERCTECRTRYEAKASARGKQRVCSAECRRQRRGRLSRRRRSQRVQEHRVDERERQRRCRARRGSVSTSSQAPAGTSSKAEVETAEACEPPAGHAPASAAKPAEIAARLLESWDLAMALSRASLQREMAAILRVWMPPAGRSEAVTAGVSRASLGSQAPGMT